ncbi:MAG: porin [Holosporales bacterium]|jgi:predicted porin|nr:porin [Holosporales bacterium]
MKKLYLVGCLALLAAPSVLAAGPKLTISGSATGFMSFTTPKNGYYKGDGTNAGGVPGEYPSVQKSSLDTSSPRVVGGEVDLVFAAKGKFSKGVLKEVDYGAIIEFDAMKGDTGVDKMYVYVGNNRYGVLQMGNVKGPEATYQCNGQSLCGGTLGVDGTVPSDVDYSTGVITPLYVIGYTNKATKVVYYSPRVYGVQLGFAFTPDTKHIGHAPKNRTTGSSKFGNDIGLYYPTDEKAERPSGRASISVGLNHQHEWTPKVKTEFSAVYLHENTRDIKVAGVDNPIKLHKVSAYTLSAKVFYGNFGVGVGYINNGKSRMPKDYSVFNPAAGPVTHHGGFLSDEGGNAGRVWNLGVQYIYDDWKFAAVYHRSSRKVTHSESTRGNMLTLTADYKVCDGFGVFFEFDHIQTKSCERACVLRNLMVNNGLDAVAAAAAGTPGKAQAIKKQTCQLYAVGMKVSF